MGGWWISDLLSNQNINGQVWVVSWIVWVVLSICLHELAHGWAAIRLGDDTPIIAGHMTWNPMVHMGAFSLIMFLIIGIAWGMMPINPSKLRGRYAESLVALAGPVMNILLATVALIGLVIWVPLCQGQISSGVTIADPLATNMQSFLAVGAMLNILLFVLNMLPLPPLDGSRILMNLSPAYTRFVMSDTGRWILLGGFVLLFLIFSVFIFIFSRLVVMGIAEFAWAIFFSGTDTPGMDLFPF
jgi:Zn-dependent protease